jgi:APA family basic amino acid/polyamine antiporter
MAASVSRTEGLSLFAAIAFAVGNMVGAGVFVLSGLVVQVAGSSALLSYLACGVIVAFSGLSYAALASIYPEDGGGYLFARKMLGSFPGFLAGWAMYISVTIATAFVLLGFGIYLNLLTGLNLDVRIFAVVGMLFLTCLNLRGLSDAGTVEMGLVVTKVAILIGLIIIGLTQLHLQDLEPFFSHGIPATIQGTTMVFFAYIGFQVVAMMGGEVKESSRKVPLATMASIGIVAVIYIGVVLALLSAHLPSYGSRSVFDAAVVLFGGIGGAIVALGAVFSTLSSANANFIGASRVMMRMATEKQVPGRFARLTRGQPSNSILLGTAIGLALILYGDLNLVVNLTNVTTLVTMALVNISAFFLVRREQQVPPEKSYFRIPLGVLIPVLGGVTTIAMIFTITPLVVVLGFAVLLAGSIFYVLEDTSEGEKAVEEIEAVLKRRQIPSRKE